MSNTPGVSCAPAGTAPGEVVDALEGLLQARAPERGEEAAARGQLRRHVRALARRGW